MEFAVMSAKISEPRPLRAPPSITDQRQDGAVVLTSTNMSESKKSVEDTLSSAIAQLEEEAALKKVSSVQGRPTVRDVGEGRRWRKTVAFDV